MKKETAVEIANWLYLNSPSVNYRKNGIVASCRSTSNGNRGNDDYEIIIEDRTTNKTLSFVIALFADWKKEIPNRILQDSEWVKMKQMKYPQFVEKFLNIVREEL